MTKLTQQEIEQERVKFESWIGQIFFSGIVSVKDRWDEERNCYKHPSVHVAFKAWLARAEIAKGEK